MKCLGEDLRPVVHRKARLATRGVEATGQLWVNAALNVPAVILK
jgi:hypothetical protein